MQMIVLLWLNLAMVLSQPMEMSEPRQELSFFFDLIKKDLPMCEGNSICAFLQANNKGLTKMEYCQCPGGYACPLSWDPYDGQSVSQGASDQYKYCGRRPSLNVCNPAGQLAYTSYQTYHGDIKVQMRDEVHCICPYGSTYQDVKYDFLEENSADIIKIDYYCLPLNICNATETCKDITEKPGEYIVNPRCMCPDNMACPSVPISDRAATTVREGDIAFTKIRCQAPYRQGFSPAEYYLMGKKKRAGAPGLLSQQQMMTAARGLMQHQSAPNRQHWNGWR